MWTFRLSTRSPGYVMKENVSDFSLLNGRYDAILDSKACS